MITNMKKEDKDALIGILASSTISFCIGIFCYTLDEAPSAIDVYRGKTTLEITYKDGVPVDSVVVFKK